MKCEDVRERFCEYLSEMLEEPQKKVMEDHLGGCETCRAQFSRMQVVWRGLSDLPDEEPSAELRSRIYAMLEDEKERKAEETRRSEHSRPSTFSLWPRRPVWQLAYAAGLLIVGLAIGSQIQGRAGHDDQITVLRQEISEMRQMISMSMMNQPSSSERLLGIQYSTQIDRPTEPLLEMLLATLNSDPNVNVRLAAVDALFAFSSRPGIRDALITSLSRQTSPLVQISLIDLLAEMRERRSLEALKSIIRNQDIDETVKQYAEKRIRELA